ncbi:metal-sulfur cluster assembly factor [Mucilaginibacter sp. HC2]|nr:metal-sulfur cluster assembly factor [Mucilaginibacter inviolabilis]
MEILSVVKDPELDLNVVDLGLIYGFSFDVKERKISILMTLSTPACPAGDYIRSAVEMSAAKAFPAFTIAVEITFNPAWSADMISEMGRRELGW